MAGIVPGMVTRKKPPLRRLYLKEHREARQVSASEMAERLGIERESVYRLEKKYWGVSSQKQAAYAAALGIEPQELWRRPEDPSLDQIIAGAPEDIQQSIEVIIRKFVAEAK